MFDTDKKDSYRKENDNENNFKKIDKDESISLMVQRLDNDRKRKIQKRLFNIRLEMMRYTLIFIDMTESMKIMDMKPTRLSSTIKHTKTLVKSYFDQNPISQLGIFIIKNFAGKKLTSFGANPKKHINALQSLNGDICEGEPFLQKVLLYAEKTLKYIPSYATGEIIIVMTSATSCDQDYIHNVIASIQQNYIRCSVIHLVSEVFIYKKPTKATSGLFQVVLDEVDMKYRFQNLVLPQSSFKENEASLIHMGFPIYCALYSCPRCPAGYCEAPIECNICGLFLVSYPHLARSYHHSFPLEVFSEQKANDTEDGKEIYKCSSYSILIGKEELRSVRELFPHIVKMGINQLNVVVRERCPETSIAANHFCAKVFNDNDASHSDVTVYKFPKQSVCCVVFNISMFLGNHLFNAMSRGCISVIFSDDYILPFFEVLDWKRCSIHMRENQVSQLYTILASINTDRIAYYQRHVRHLFSKYMSIMGKIVDITLIIIEDRYFPFRAKIRVYIYNIDTNVDHQTLQFIIDSCPTTDAEALQDGRRGAPYAFLIDMCYFIYYYCVFSPTLLQVNNIDIVQCPSDIEQCSCFK